MKRLALVTLAVVTVAACASEPATVATAPQPQPAQAPGGTWEVVADYAAESVGALVSPYVGQPMVLEAARAVDPAGRLCKTPQYWQSQAAAAEVLGHPAQPQAAHDPAPRSVVTVTCDGAPFAALVSQPDGGWLTRQGAWVLKVAVPQPKPAAAPVALESPAPIPAPAAAKPRHDPRVMVYLASYKTEASARAGFKTLAKASPVLAGQQPITQAVDLGKKGKWIRLYGMAANPAERTALCKQLGKRVDECGAQNRE